MTPDITSDFLKQLIACSPVAAVISSGSSESVVYLNPKFSQLFGYTIEDIPTIEEWWLFAYPDKRYRNKIKQEWFKRIEQAIAKKAEIVPMETRVICKDGSHRWIKALASSIGDYNMVVFEDITLLKKTELMLRESEATAKALLNAPTETAILSELDGTIVALNDAAAKGIGKPAKELIGVCAFDFFPAEVACQRKIAVQKVVQKKKAYRFQDQRGDRVFDINIDPVFDSIGEVVRIAVFAEDITDRKRAEEKLIREMAFTDSAINAQRDTFFVFEPESGKAVRWNKAFEDVSGYSHEEVATLKAPDSYYDEGDLKKAAKALEELFSSGQASVELTLVSKDGHRIPIEYSVSTFEEPDTDVKLVVSIGRDITERKRGAMMLLDAKESAEAANRAKSEFLANMSHEVRTPISAISGVVRLLGETEFTEEQGKFIGLLSREASHLNSITTEILDLSKVEAGIMVLDESPFNLPDAISSAIASLAQKAAQKQLNLNYTTIGELPQTLVGDEGRLKQVLLNLLGNAIKFTDKGGVKLTVEQLPTDDELVALSFRVEDTGIGIPAEQQATIFEPFTQADTSFTRNNGGAGLGLAIAFRLAKLQRGDITVESIPGVGTTFTFTAMLKPAPRQEEQIKDQTSLADGGSQPKLKILIAEDNEVIQMVQVLLFEKDGHTVVAANSGPKVLEHFEAETFDIIFMDVQMPGMDGLEVTRRIREIETGRIGRTPIVAFTAHAMEEDKKRCLDVGMDIYMPKPFMPEDLAGLLKKLSANG